MEKLILVIDDKPEFRKLTKMALSREYKVETAENGLQALAMLQKGVRPDLIVSDLMMPEVNGEEFITQLKSSGTFNDIPVIVLSSIDKSSERARLLKTGAADYMIKPYNPEELLARIGLILK